MGKDKIENLYTPQDIADRYRVTKQTVYKWISRRGPIKLSSMKMGKRAYIKESHIAEFEEQYGKERLVDGDGT